MYMHTLCISKRDIICRLDGIFDRRATDSRDDHQADGSQRLRPEDLCHTEGVHVYAD